MYKKDYMSSLFKIHDLDKYYIDNTLIYKDNMLCQLDRLFENNDVCDDRVIEILEYIKVNTHITNYVAVDDINLTNGLENNFVYTANKGYLAEEHADKCIEILLR
jgi:hypothetical protein